MAIIKIKFKDTITMPSSATTFNITFTTPENSDEYNKMIVNYNNEGGINYYYNSSVTAVYNSSGWRSYVYKVIEIDPTQPNFQAFITAMKSNIMGVELEAGTYKWVDSPTKPSTNVSTSISDCKYNRLNSDGSYKSEFGYYASSLDAYNSTITAHSKTIIIEFGNGIERVNYGTNGGWQFDDDDSNITPSGSNDLLRSIKLLSNQYINYDFYNYAILGNQLVKQSVTPSGTHKLTFDSNITITVNGSSVTTSPYNLNNGDVITATTGGGYKISINGTLYGGTSTININNQDINIVRSTAETFDVLLVTINYTETTTPTYSFKHWKKSNVVVNRTLVGEKYYYFKPYTILWLYTITTSLTNCTGASANATKIQENGDLTLTFTANSGYELPTGVSVTNVTSYNWNKATGVLAISKPTGDVVIEIVAVSALPQLSTPTNVAVTDTTLTFDEVANATSYEVFVDNVSIGTHTIQTTETWLLNETLSGTLAKTPIKFYSNNTWYSISVEPFVSGTTLLYYYESVEGEEDTYDEVYSNGTWNNKAYRTITFETAPTGDLLTWLQANGVKQASPLIIKKGTYIWNDTFVQTADVDLDNKLNFKSNNIDFFELFISFYIDDSNKTIDYVSAEELINVYSNGTWSNVAYKTIIVTTDTFVDSDFYTFFNANTTKQ